MVNDSTKKTNDNFSHQITEHEKGHEIWTYDVLKPGPGLGQAYNMAFRVCSTNKLQRCAIKHIHWSVICNFANYRLLSYLTLVSIY